MCAALATVAAAVHLPQTLDELHDRAAANSELSFADREFAGGNSVVLDQEALYQARARIPPDGSFRVETGDGLQTDNALTAPFIGTFATYFLLPRRLDDDAPWIICYGCDLTRYGDRARVVWRNDAGIAIARLAG